MLLHQGVRRDVPAMGASVYETYFTSAASRRGRGRRSRLNGWAMAPMHHGSVASRLVVGVW